MFGDPSHGSSRLEGVRRAPSLQITPFHSFPTTSRLPQRVPRLPTSDQATAILHTIAPSPARVIALPINISATFLDSSMHAAKDAPPSSIGGSTAELVPPSLPSTNGSPSQYGHVPEHTIHTAPPLPIVNDSVAPQVHNTLTPKMEKTTPKSHSSSLTGLFIGNVPFKINFSTMHSDNKFPVLFHNSSHETLYYVPPSTQNGEIILRPSVEMIRVLG
ncbi:UNVERIFIED_CONTAM: hypothetical protein Sangu_2903900 [Sesamum angustifolium]|uniref:Uncharacterized protein n=1 Tax=Sesamum angustifolium TaxID=2727405 RepID=A0AAW2ILZ5_9LAMI